MQGTLYLVGTPIGNMEDMTYRAVRTLGEVDLIAAEDTRHTRPLLERYGIDKPLTSYHEHNRAQKGPQLVQLLLEGTNIALVTDAGMPAISDPGEDLVRLCREAGVPVTVVPGPSAVISAVALSGLPAKGFLFEGFLSAKKGERQKRLAQLADFGGTLVFYEAPHKLRRTLEDLLEALGNRQVVLCRELTKKFEQVLCLPLEEAAAFYQKQEPKGEFVLLVEGKPAQTELFEMGINAHVEALIAKGLSKKEAVAQCAIERGIPKKEVYNSYMVK